MCWKAFFRDSRSLRELSAIFSNLRSGSGEKEGEEKKKENEDREEDEKKKDDDKDGMNVKKKTAWEIEGCIKRHGVVAHLLADEMSPSLVKTSLFVLLS